MQLLFTSALFTTFNWEYFFHFRCIPLSVWSTWVASFLEMKMKPLQKLFSHSSCLRYMAATKTWFVLCRWQVWLHLHCFSISTKFLPNFWELDLTWSWSWQMVTKPTLSSSLNLVRAPWSSASWIQTHLSSRCSIQSTSSKTSITTSRGTGVLLIKMS